MSPVAVGGHAARIRFPRVSGDEPVKGVDDVWTPLFSPRERG